MRTLIALALLIATPAAASELHHMVDQVADKHGVPRHIAHAVVKAESKYNCRAVGHGTYGIMQVKKATARSVGVTGDLLDCSTGLEAGMRYLKIAITKGGTGCAGVSLYAAGVGNKPHCSAYGRKVLRK